MARGESLADDLARDLGEVLGQPVAAAGFTGRRDGAVAPLIGLLAEADPLTRSMAARLAAEWTAAGSVDSVRPAEFTAPSGYEFPTLRAGETTLLTGLRTVPPTDGDGAAGTVGRLADTAAMLLGGVAEVVLIEPGRPATQRVPGWLARLRLLTIRDEVKAEPADQWAVATHEAVSSVYLPSARHGSLWRDLLGALTAYTMRVLIENGSDVQADLFRRDDPSFRKYIDLARCSVLSGHPQANGHVLQVVRPPRMAGGDLTPGYALLAPEGN
ncbi:hypothetical protein GCM10010112_26590 [Actinoplanes lobatus]|uniref:Uncharacterized protein n=1 Tax=Actinoplanes lobatus TaxID=113568 RepID=A0A7W7HJI6_9ACTN|nr:hypothetical protein [Actinoplanes lobatus]MBB4751700.1 hypothetical protein [Actinoplanes lobatus]GGN65333.1 hypothetical protein GCM10010112_26590 [Actinoplanes lobatus]GIE43283.1 hypothetical protein Alo02nite_61810 [Actinoplanes lobatus]